MANKKVKVCGQCCTATGDDYYYCETDGDACTCELALCSTCSDPLVHFDENGNCPDWWGKDLTEKEVEELLQEAADDAAQDAESE